MLEWAEMEIDMNRKGFRYIVVNNTKQQQDKGLSLILLIKSNLD